MSALHAAELPDLVLVAAIGENNVIGRDNQLPWRLRSDLQHFKSVTIHKPVVMGRRTYESIGKALKDRTNIVVTRDLGLQAPGCVLATSLEAALLAVLPQAPSRLRPDRWPERAEAARNKVLDRMVTQGVWSASQVKESREEAVWLAPRQMPQLAPLFSRMMLSKSRDTKIVTTLDASLQRQLEELAMNWKSRLPARSSLAMIVVDHTDMKVRGWVGSVDINDDTRFSHVDMVNAIRSPGSVLKPFIYGMALDDGLIHPASLLQDVPRKTGDYRPGNFDSGFHGPVSMSEALVRSLNLPAVQVLEAYGPKRFAAMLSNAGLPLILPAGAQPNLSLILGGAGARLADITAAYSAFARHGKAGRLRLQPGDPLSERPLLSQGAAWIIRRILANEAQPLPDNALPQGVPLAWKTGTSYGYRDAWAVGLNARYVIGIWTGRPDGTPVGGGDPQGPGQSARTHQPCGRRGLRTGREDARHGESRTDALGRRHPAKAGQLETRNCRPRPGVRTRWQHAGNRE